MCNIGDSLEDRPAKPTGTLGDFDKHACQGAFQRRQRQRRDTADNGIYNSFILLPAASPVAHGSAALLCIVLLEWEIWHPTPPFLRTLLCGQQVTTREETGGSYNTNAP